MARPSSTPSAPPVPARRLAIAQPNDGAARYWDALEPGRLFGAALPSVSPPGSFVVVEVLERDAAREVQLLSVPGTALHEVYRLFVEAGLTPCFPSSVEAEAAQWQARPDIYSDALRDLEALPFVTIDGEQSRDLDQALFIEQTTAGFVVYYALADASHYVRPGTALFDEALLRGSSYYLPGAMIPMLPPALSEGLISLNPLVTRRALVFEIHLDRAGAVTNTQVLRARIRSRAKLTFRQVQAFYDAPLSSPLRGETFAISLDHLRTVGELRLTRAQERNVVRYRRIEVEAHLPFRETRRFVVTEAIRERVEAYNEQLSLLCNSEGARLLDGARSRPLIEPIFRIHPEPDPALLERFRRLTDTLTRLHGLDDRWRWAPQSALAEYLAKLPNSPDSVAAAIHRQAVMLNVGSSFDVAPSAHFGVGSSVYARFSAPMREIVGVYLHRELTQLLGGTPTDDEALRQAVVDRGNRARQLQNRLTNASNLLVLDQLFGDHLTEPGSAAPLMATIVGLTPKKIHVRFDAPPVDAKIHVEDLRRDWGEALTVSDDGAAVYHAGAVRLLLGQRVRVVVLGHDDQRGRWLLGIAR